MEIISVPCRGLKSSKGPGRTTVRAADAFRARAGTMRLEETLDAIADKLREMRQVGYQMRSYDAPQRLAAMRGTRPEAAQHYER